ncbi:hypothetical protein SLE2022_085080 [Rubroshorea leprosula]
MIMEEGGRWLIVGDFNAVRSIKERRGRTGESPDMKEFNDFIEAVGLVDHKLANRRFTWYRPDGTSMSRLDRVLMTSEMTELGGEWVQQGLKRTISDHCAIVMKTRVSDWGPREALWRQKSRSNWVKLGDANTRFFHKIANGRKACNGIVGLSCDGQWVEEPELVKKAAVDYF